jgi:hypothetical protein
LIGIYFEKVVKYLIEIYPIRITVGFEMNRLLNFIHSLCMSSFRNNFAILEVNINILFLDFSFILKDPSL